MIAPGTYVNDVSRALAGGDRGGQRILGVAPYSRSRHDRSISRRATPIEQAIGPDPFKPQAFRVWMWEDVPGQFPAAVFDIRNNGAASRYSVMSDRRRAGQCWTTCAKRHEQKPAWDNVFVVDTAAGGRA